ncbi:MAG: hypothetical protein ACTSQE_08295 [Candidatus Heimdallarchaeaceae archaeon]
MYLTRDEYKVLLALQKDPLSSISDIKDDINYTYGEDKTFYSIKKAFTNLLDKGIIRNFAASIDPEKIDLKRECFFFETKNYKKMENLERILDNHNYSRYRSRAIAGDKKGIYAEFEIPEGTKHFLEELINKLKSKNFVEKVVSFEKGAETVKTDIDMRYVDPSTLKWTFDLNKWVNKEYSQKSSSDDKKRTNETLKVQKINETDLWLMRILTINPRQKNKELLERLNEEKKRLTQSEFSKDLSTISRRKHYILENYIGDTQVIVDDTLFSLDVRMMLEIKMNKRRVKEIKEKLRANPLPFRTNFVDTKTGFRWYIFRSPSKLVNEIINWLWSLDPEAMSVMHWLPYGRLYWFYPLNYDINAGDWIKTYEHFFEPVEKFLN